MKAPTIPAMKVNAAPMMVSLPVALFCQAWRVPIALSCHSTLVRMDLMSLHFIDVEHEAVAEGRAMAGGQDTGRQRLMGQPRDVRQRAHACPD